ncbi:hypothetical protein [Streptomyces humi]|uniref:hypothetical protein n=1 Tax=Streptomyces humi TaxID=1428620 RepID=UPI00062895BC|nr:hypothetical protein [Streptomyces humi]
MDETGELITQLGLLLTQTRFGRRALEDIERATSTYGTFAFTSVITAGPHFGAPPLFEGALKVYVVNIDDLAPGGGFGDFLSGLLGGLGGFVGNLVGGVAGGAVSQFKLVWSFHDIAAIAEHVEHILTLIGGPSGTATAASGAGTVPPGPGTGLVARLDGIRSAVDSLTALFRAGGSAPAGGPAVAARPLTDQLGSATALLTAVAKVVDGLVIALPVAVGSLALLVDGLGDIRFQLAESLRFGLRVALLLRGSLLVLALDTVAVVARVGATVVGVLAGTVDGIIGGVFTGVQQALLAVLRIGATLGDAVRATVDGLLDWLIPTVGTVLRDFGERRVFRVITHLVRILPAVLPLVFELKTDTQLTARQQGALDDAAKLGLPASVLGGNAPVAVRPAVPNPVAPFTDPAFVTSLTEALGGLRTLGTDAAGLLGGAASDGLRTLGSTMEAAALAESRRSDARLGSALDDVNAQSARLADRLVVGEAVTPKTGLTAVADAYETWLTKGGLDGLLATITGHFTGPAGRDGIPRSAVESADRTRAVIQIDEVVVDVASAAPGPVATAPVALTTAEPARPAHPSDDIDRHARMWFDYDQRGGGSRLPRPL